MPSVNTILSDICQYPSTFLTFLQHVSKIDSLATEQVRLPVRYQLYRPKNWADDVERRRKAEVPEEIRFQTKQDIALDQIRPLRD